MSHFTVLITNTDKRTVEDQLAPFDENREMPLHTRYTKEQLIENSKKEVEDYKNGTYAKYLKDPEAYRADCSNPRHLEYVEVEFPKKLTFTDEEHYAEAIKYYEADDLDENGGYQTTYNDYSKWDWYQVGGRWAGFFISKAGTVGAQGYHSAKAFASITGDEVEDLPEQACDVIQVRNIDWNAMDKKEQDERAELWDKWHNPKEGEQKPFIWSKESVEKLDNLSKEDYVNQPVYHSTFAVLHKGKWYERGEMGWFGMSSNDKPTEQWDKEFKKLIDSLDPEAEVSIVDCHI